MKLLVLFFAAAINVFGQSLDRSGSDALSRPDYTYLEMLGSGLNISANYERVFMDASTVRVGIGAYGFNTGNNSFQWVPVVPVTVNHYFGQGNTRIEVGGGAIFHLTNYGWETMFPGLSDARVKGTLELGLRYMPATSAFVGGVRFTPVFDGTGIAPWLGFYVGWGF